MATHQPLQILLRKTFCSDACETTEGLKLFVVGKIRRDADQSNLIADLPASVDRRSGLASAGSRTRQFRAG